MKLQVDSYADLGSLLHGWEPRCKFVALMALIFAFSFVRDLCLLPVMLLVTGFFYLLSRLPFSFLLERLRLPGFFFLVVAFFLPLLSGQTVLFHLGPIAVKKEGCLDLLLITAKFLCILTTAVILFGTTPFLTTLKAMAALGLPPILVDMALFSYRYLYEIGNDLKKMETAMKLRGFRNSSLRSAAVLAFLAGTLLVRSYERSDRVYKAMVLRGYGGPGSFRSEFKAGKGDLIGLLGTLLVAAALVFLQIYKQISIP